MGLGYGLWLQAGWATGCGGGAAGCGATTACNGWGQIVKRTMALVIAGWSIALLAACGDKPQEMGGAVRQDTPAFNGTGTPYVASGWKPGDKASWEQHLRTRAQNSQNDYSKAN